MAIDPDKLLALRFPEVEQHYTDKDVILYALGVGLGHDPLDATELAFVYEKHLAVLPTFPLAMAWPGFWPRDPATGIDWVRLVAGEQDLRLHRPLAPRGTLVSRMRVTDVIDKGRETGALVYTERRLSDKASGALVATITETVVCRGDGGFGGPVRATPPVHRLPTRAPDVVCERATRPEMALLYRLSGDRNPLHADPAIAKAAGFTRPVLHGLATFGATAYAILKTFGDNDPARLSAIAARYSAPVFPGETLRVEMWQDGSAISFRVHIVERDATVINNGRAELRAGIGQEAS